MKSMFRDVLQETLEAEMDSQLGYDKYDISEKQTPNSRNSYSKKTVKSELGAVELIMFIFGSSIFATTPLHIS